MKYSKRKDKYCCNVLNDNFQEIDERLTDLEKNGGGGSGGGGSSNVVYLTQAEYDALPDTKLSDDIEYRITDGNIGASKASNVSYDNSFTGLKAINVQGAVDEVIDRLGDVLSVGNETYNSVEKILKYYIDNGYLPDINNPEINLPLVNLTDTSYLKIRDNNNGTATLIGVIACSSNISSTKNIVDVNGVPTKFRPISNVAFTAVQSGPTNRTITIKTDGSITINALNSASSLEVEHTYSLT